jgi:magnesium transporter
MVHNSKLLEIFLDTKSQHLDDEQVKQGSKLNDIVKIFTAVSLAFFPFIVVSGLFGMNCTIPGSEIQDSMWPFWTIIGGCSLTAILIIIYFRLSGILKKSD